MIRALALAGAGCASALLVTGCAATASAPPKQSPALDVPTLESVSAVVERVVRLRLQPIAARSIRRAAEEMTVRVRNVSCDGIWVGSGFAIAPRVLLTNRHVLAGASELEINTWDGEDDSVGTAFVGALGDLGVATTDRPLPKVARFGLPAKAGDLVTVVGYPLGGPLTLAQGTVIDRVDGAPFGINGAVLRLTAAVEHGNSGGPVLDSQGHVVAVVFAIETATGFGLAIPIDTVAALVRAGGFQNVPPCESS